MRGLYSLEKFRSKPLTESNPPVLFCLEKEISILPQLCSLGKRVGSWDSSLPEAQLPVHPGDIIEVFVIHEKSSTNCNGARAWWCLALEMGQCCRSWFEVSLI